MLAYIRALINIAFLKAGPEDLPASQFLLGITLVFYVLAQVPVSVIAYRPGAMPLQIIAVSLLLAVAGLWILLVLTGHRSRYVQTLTALLGTSALLTLLSVPLSLWRQAMSTTDPPSAIPVLGIVVIMLWSIAIDGHILARALSKPFFIGLLVAVAYFFLHTTLLFELVPRSMSS